MRWDEDTDEEDRTDYRELPAKTLVILAHRGDPSAVEELQRRERVRADRDQE